MVVYRMAARPSAAPRCAAAGPPTLLQFIIVLMLSVLVLVVPVRERLGLNGTERGDTLTGEAEAGADGGTR